MSHRDFALQVLSRIEQALARGRPLSPNQREYLLEVCRLARESHPDPLGIRRPVGPPKTAPTMEMAQAVRNLMNSGKSYSDACELVGENYGVSGCDGGTTAQAYLQHRDEILAAEIIYSNRKSNEQQIAPTEVDQLTEHLERAFFAANKTNKRKSP